MAKEHANTKKIKVPDALEGIYFDFEGRTDEDPVLVGLYYRKEPENPSTWVIDQLVLDPGLLEVDAASGAPNQFIDQSEIVRHLAAMADDRARPLISWSEHDWIVAKRISNNLAFRYRNALPTVKPWKNSLRDNDLIVFPRGKRNKLANYEEIVGYARPPEHFDVGDSIAYIRGLKSITDGAIRRWQTILRHNRHDLIAMRDVVLTSLGIADH